jgi:uncharacterized membrane protein
VAISGYSINGHWWLLLAIILGTIGGYWWLLLVIIFVALGGCFIGDYYWLFD